VPQSKAFYRLISASMIALFLTVFVAAQNNGEQQSQTQNNPNGAPFPAAPIPVQIPAARQIFISNVPGINLNLAGGPTRTYDQFYAAVTGLQKYQLASSPAAADLVFEISIARQIDAADGGVQLRLVMVDPKTNVPLWTIGQHIEVAVRKATAERNFDNAMAQLLNQLKQVTSTDAGGPAVK